MKAADCRAARYPPQVTFHYIAVGSEHGYTIVTLLMVFLIQKDDHAFDTDKRKTLMPENRDRVDSATCQPKKIQSQMKPKATRSANTTQIIPQAVLAIAGTLPGPASIATSLKIDEDVRALLELMQSKVATYKLIAVAECLLQMAKLLWSRYPQEQNAIR